MKDMIKNVTAGNLPGAVSCKGGNLVANELRDFWEDEEGMGTIEVVLILVVLIGLVLVFKESIGDVLDNIMGAIETNASGIYAPSK